MAVPAEKLTLSDYLAWENLQTGRHEFYRGEVFSMVGVRRIHGKVVLNLAIAISNQLKGSGCEVFVESLKLQVAEDAVFYPDLFVTCDRRDLVTDMIFRKPKLIVEVLSDSTQAYDRGLKFAAYRQIEELREYVLIDPQQRVIEVFRRNERNVFELHDQTGAAGLHLTSVDLHVAMADVFNGVDAAAS
jgi:Uma2 family endonuclease